MLGINKWLCIYDKPLFITNQLTIFMVIEWSYRRYNQIFDQQSCCGDRFGTLEGVLNGKVWREKKNVDLVANRGSFIINYWGRTKIPGS